MTKFHAALQRRKIVDELSDKYLLESIEFVTFKLEKLHVYKEMHSELTRLGLIILGNFEDPLWSVLGESNNSRIKRLWLILIYWRTNCEKRCTVKIYG